MAHEAQLDIREMGQGVCWLEFPYNEDFIESIKRVVPWQARRYDEDTHVWIISGEQYMSVLEGLALQRFDHVARISQRGNDKVFRNVRTGVETVQGGLF